MGTNKNVKWLPLDVDALDDPKIMALVAALGMEGYGVYIMLIQYLAKQEPYYELSMNFLKHLAYRNHVSEEKVKAVICGFDLFEVDNECFYSKSLLRRMEPYNNLKSINREKAIKRWSKEKEIALNNAAALPEHCSGNADKNRIEYNRIDKNINKKEKKYSNIPPSIDEIKLRMEERKITSFSAETFHAHYTSNGWMVGKSKMRNWDAALSTWNNNSSSFATGTKSKTTFGLTGNEMDYSEPQNF